MTEENPRKLYLVRHAESLWNRERRVQGTCLDVPLSDEGRLQAKRLGSRLRSLASVFYSSDALRALDTAKIALGGEREIFIEPSLRELCLGEWEGKLLSDLREKEPDALEAWYRKPSSVVIAGSENLVEFTPWSESSQGIKMNP